MFAFGRDPKDALIEIILFFLYFEFEITFFVDIELKIKKSVKKNLSGVCVCVCVDRISYSFCFFRVVWRVGMIIDGLLQ